MVGKKRAGPPVTREQRQRRRDFVVRCKWERYPNEEIAAALGVKLSLVAADIREEARRMEGLPRATWRTRRPSVPLQPFDWRSRQVSSPAGQVWRRTSPVRHVAVMLAGCEDENGMNRLAHNVIAAREAGDTAWESETIVTLQKAQALTTAMLEIMTSEEAASEAASDTLFRGDLTNMPPPGTGQRPLQIHGTIWRHAYAGLSLSDPATIRSISRAHKYSDAAIRRAIASYRARFPDAEQ